MNQFRTLKKSENFYINLVNGKTFADWICVLLVSIVQKHLLQKEKKMYFFLLVLVNFLVMLLFLVIILLHYGK